MRDFSINVKIHFNRGNSMIVYSNKVSGFNLDVDRGLIASIIHEKLREKGFNIGSESEFRSWNNSLFYMKNILTHDLINQDLHVAIEYQIPITSKRVDFMISGFDENNEKNVVIIELKQWEQASASSRDDLVTTFLGGALRAVTHPSYQAYSYAKTIENYNEYVQKDKIILSPSAYLHNYEEMYRHELEHPKYLEIIEKAPIFLKQDAQKLREFINKYVKSPDNGQIMYEIEHGKIKPSKALQDALSSMIHGNQEFYMIDEQKVAFSTVKKLVARALEYNEKHTVIIEGGPGTGKSVIAINLLAHFKTKLVHYVTKNAAPRHVYFSKMRQGNHELNYIRTVFKGSGAYINAAPNQFDCLLVDEAHRLNEKSGMFSNLGTNQIKEIINASKVSVFFIDEDQIVTTKDFGSVAEIKKQAKLLGSKLHFGEEYNLTSQFRCNGSDGYIAFLDHILGIRETANFDGFDLDYDIKLFDSPVTMREALREKNNINNKARMIAGYCYEWVTRNKIQAHEYDIVLDDFKAKWNFSNTNTWAIDEDSFDQVGCIHTAQGLEFDYVGIIIGQDLIYRDGKVLTDYTKRARTDASLKGIKTTKNFELADRIIRNTYKTLLSRGQKGCYIYCEDKALANYLSNKLIKTRKKY